MRRIEPFAVILVLIAGAMAGCSQDPERDGGPGPSLGTVAGRVTDDSGLAVAGAVVRILTTAAETTTGPDGSFRFEDVPAGKARLAVSAPGFLTTTRTITVPDRGLAMFAFSLQPVAVVEPYRETLPFTGTISCGVPTGIACPEDVDPNATTHAFEVEAGLRGMIVELEWTPSAAGLAEELAFDVMAATPTACGAKYAGAEGQPPLRQEVTEGHPISGGHQCVKVRPGGNSTVVEQDYSLRVTVFYHEAPPHGFTALS